MANKAIHQWTTAPIHIGEQSIVLAPLPLPEVPSPTDQQQVVLREESLLQTKSRCRILISVTLTEFGTQSPGDAWVEWFRDHAPANIAAIDFLDVVRPVAALSSNSDYLIFRLPVSVWNAMTPNPAIKFLSIVYSDNVLYHGADGSRGKAAVETPEVREISQGRFGQLLRNDPLARHLTSLPNPVDLHHQTVASSHEFDEEPDFQRGRETRASENTQRLTVNTENPRSTNNEISRKPSSFYGLGKVFSTVWSEPAGESDEQSRSPVRLPFVIPGRYGGDAIARVQRFVVIREGLSYCNVLPISTHGERGVAKRGLVKSEHCIIYTDKSAATQPGEQSMMPKPIRMDPESPVGILHPMSRLDLARVMTLDHNLRV